MSLRNDLEKALAGSVCETFSTMFSVELTEADVPKEDPSAELICNIGMTGKLEGNITLFLTAASACAIVSRMLGTEIKVVSPDICDGMCEVANLFAGGVKMRMAPSGFPFEVSIPTVVQGRLMHTNVTVDLDKIIRRFFADGFAFDVEFVYKLHQESVVSSPAGSSAVSKMSAFEKLKAMTAQRQAQK